MSAPPIRRRTIRASILLLLLATVAALAVPAGAGAAEYRVEGCVAGSASTGGWAPAVGKVGGATASACPPGLTATLAGPIAASTNADHAGWKLAPPVGTVIAGFELTRSVTITAAPDATDPPYTYTLAFQAAGATTNTNIERCTSLATCGALPATISGSQLASQLIAKVACRAAGCPAGTSGQLTIAQWAVRLQDTAPPVVQSLTGGLLAPGGVGQGTTQSFAVEASDVGGGIAHVSLTIDGAPRGDWAVAGTGCAAPYHELVPCPTTVREEHAVDLAGLAPGSHAVTATVTDAAGQTGSATGTLHIKGGPAPPPAPAPTPTPPAPPAAPVLPSELAPTTVTPVAAESRPVGPPAHLSAELRAAGGKTATGDRVVCPHGTPVRIEGRLLGSSGSPLSGQALVVTARESGPGIEGRAEQLGTVTTRSDGRYRVRIPAGPSRIVEVAFAGRGAAGPAQRTVKIDVRAGVTFTAPRSARRGRPIKLSGSVADAAGKLVELQARNGRRWQTFAVVRTDDLGRFDLTYRFRRPGPAARYRLRARVPAERGFPYLTAASAVRAIRVR